MWHTRPPPRPSCLRGVLWSVPGVGVSVGGSPGLAASLPSHAPGRWAARWDGARQSPQGAGSQRVPEGSFPERLLAVAWVGAASAPASVLRSL